MARRYAAWCAVAIATGPGPTTFADDAPALLVDPTVGMELVLVRGGCFEMGDAGEPGGPEERPAHEVCVDDFYIGKYEVTQGQWKAVMGSNPSRHVSCGNACPVETVSWNDTQIFLERLNGRSRLGRSPTRYRLPTEAEWEYAARSGGKDERYSGGGDDVDAVAWHLGSDRLETHAVGLKAPNGLGVHDLTGNVWEWTNDWYGEGYYAKSPRDNPSGPSSGTRRVVRGGAFPSGAFDSRTTYRNHLPPDQRSSVRGFRIVRAAPRPTGKPAAPESAAKGTRGAARDTATGMELVLVHGGCFRMGDLWSDGVSGSGEGLDERPVHEVCVGDYYIGKFEVTQGQWKAVMGGAAPASDENCHRDDCAVDEVGWSGIHEFLAAMNRTDGSHAYRLPTEAEWEYAARSGGRAERYAGGNDLDSVGWYEGNSGYHDEPRPKEIGHPVGRLAPNGLGIHDMSGNVNEITSDWYDATFYARSPRDRPTGAPSGSARVKRGGNASGHPGNARTVRRDAWEGAAALTGFRVVRNP